MDSNLAILGIGLLLGLLALILILHLLPGPGDENADLYADRLALDARDDIPRRRSPLRRLLRLLRLR